MVFLVGSRQLFTSQATDGPSYSFQYQCDRLHGGTVDEDHARNLLGKASLKRPSKETPQGLTGENERRWES